jgi:CBS domain containing-hemolysin-like protein
MPDPALSTASVPLPPKNQGPENPASDTMATAAPRRSIAQWLRAFVRQREESLRDEVRDLIEDVTDEAAADLPQAERTLLTNVLNLQEKTAADCMIPRANIVAVDAETSLEQLIVLMTKVGHSRIPVYRETLDDIVGMVHIKDVMACLVQKRDCLPIDLLRQMLFVAPSMPVLRLLAQMRESRQHMACVVDEFGGIDGLVTIEDLIEEIIGDIEDEHDIAPLLMFIRKADGSILVDASMTLEEFERRTLPFLSEEDREETDTLGGLIFTMAGHVPDIGGSFTHASGATFEVLDADTRRIKRLRVRNLPTSATAVSA